MNGTLYIIAAPIGNIEDISGRAKRVLAEVDVIASEDTRTAQKLLRLLGIKNKTVSNHKFNEKSQLDFLLSVLEDGRDVAVVSDAGTPCISDPGGIIVRAAAKRGIEVIAVPGASSVTTALSLCGFDIDYFSFYGFLPKEVKGIRKIINAALNSGISVFVFFESPKRIMKSLEVFVSEIPEAELCLCNDLTKMYERVYRGKPELVLRELIDNPAAEKGEYTCVVRVSAGEKADEGDSLCLEAMLVDYIVKGEGVSLKEAVQVLSGKYRGVFAKRDFYAASLRLREIFRGNKDDVCLAKGDSGSGPE